MRGHNVIVLHQRKKRQPFLCQSPQNVFTGLNGISVTALKRVEITHVLLMGQEAESTEGGVRSNNSSLD